MHQVSSDSLTILTKNRRMLYNQNSYQYSQRSFLNLLCLQVRKELAAVLVFESHAKAGTVCECGCFGDVWAWV